MSVLYEAPALNSTHRYLKAFLLRFRRFVNRAVANMLESRERQASRCMLRQFDDRQLKDIGLRRMHIGTRIALLALVVAASLAPAVAQAGEVRDHRGGRVQVAPRTTPCDSRNHTHTPDGGCVTATGNPTVRDHRSR